MNRKYVYKLDEEDNIVVDHSDSNSQAARGSIPEKKSVFESEEEICFSSHYGDVDIIPSLSIERNIGEHRSKDNDDPVVSTLYPENSSTISSSRENTSNFGGFEGFGVDLEENNSNNEQRLNSVDYSGRVSTQTGIRSTFLPNHNRARFDAAQLGRQPITNHPKTAVYIIVIVAIVLLTILSFYLR